MLLSRGMASVVRNADSSRERILQTSCLTFNAYSHETRIENQASFYSYAPRNQAAPVFNIAVDSLGPNLALPRCEHSLLKSPMES